MDPYLGEIRIFAGTFAPRGWALCNGALVPIRTNTALFSLLGVTYGGDGKSTFGLPDLRGRLPVGMGQGPGQSSYPQGEMTGTETVTLTTDQIPAHIHSLQAVPNSDQGTPANNVFSAFPTSHGQGLKAYAPSGTANPVAMNASALASSGSSAAHDNHQPYLTLNFIIATQGIFPPRQ